MTKANTVPQAPGGLPLVGHAPQLLRGVLEFLRTLPAHGDLVGVRLGPLRGVVVCDPELTREMLRSDHIFDKGGPFFGLARELAGPNLATCVHGQHRRQRHLVQPAFARDRFPAYGRVMSRRASAVAGDWHGGQVVDVLAEIQRITMSTLMETMFADEMPLPVQRRAIADLSTIFGGSFLHGIVPNWLAWLPGLRKRMIVRAADRLRGDLAVIISGRRADGTDHGDLLSALLASGGGTDRETTRRPPHSGFTEAEIGDQAMALLGAGTDTTAATLAWALHLLAQHPDIQRRLHTEVDDVLSGGPALLNHLPELPLTGRIVTETLRLFPPAWLVPRVVAVDTVLGCHRLPAGTTVFYSPYAIHHRGDLYENPQRFDPDRWDDSRRPQPPRHTYLPFGGGTRKCIGDQFALREAVLALATLTARWHLHPVAGQPVTAYPGIELRPRGLRLRVTARPGRAPFQPTSSPRGPVPRRR
ncbi:cytochrome P450 [Streptomyces sp. A3M-1-3]|uniref:cytochrome P450 n=1 Tax=Streptomyces sp. A3M-1-3 TaxID=2962044 RepID=UPI0020B675AB|nr:cytochrome P450 [Streptomyces sp. A3M-1-3]MCP3819387.1 cytochrome P450 [Streptomyces sp. A3M-1-3]